MSRAGRRDSTAYGNNGYGYYGAGLINPLTGAGTSLDKNAASYYVATRLTSRNQMETLTVESWAAGKFINIPVNDMFVRWRKISGPDDTYVKKVERAERKFKLRTKLSKAMKAARMYGTGLLILMTKEASPDTPLNISRMMPGDLANILVIDRFDAQVIGKDNDPYSMNYGRPTFYRITLKRGGSFDVHHSRVIRFDGIKPVTDNSWSSYDEDWGVSPLIPVITEILQDSNVAKGVAHLVNESSIAVQKVEGFEDAISGSGDETSLYDRQLEVTRLRSIFRTVYMDSEDEYSREDVTFSGLPDVMDRNAMRLSAAADIPATRFWGKSPQGMNSTGKSEERNYSLKVASDQENMLTEPLDIIDKVLARHLNLSEPIEYEFPSILDQSEDEQASIALKKSQAIVPLVNAAIIDEDEARAAIDGDDVFGEVEDRSEAGDSPAVDEYRKTLANKQVEATAAAAAIEGKVNGETQNA